MFRASELGPCTDANGRDGIGGARAWKLPDAPIVRQDSPHSAKDESSADSVETVADSGADLLGDDDERDRDDEWLNDSF